MQKKKNNAKSMTNESVYLIERSFNIISHARLYSGFLIMGNSSCVKLVYCRASKLMFPDEKICFNKDAFPYKDLGPSIRRHEIIKDKCILSIQS